MGFDWKQAGITVASGGLNLLGSDRQRRENTKSREQDQRQFEESLGRQDEANRIAREIAEKNFQMQNEFARHGIRWKVEDAKEAGLHPLAVLGSQGSSFSPVSLFQDNSVTPPSRSPANKHSIYRDLGQDISRAIGATQTKEERMRDALTTEHMHLENELLKAQILNINRPNNPPFPGSGSFDMLPGQGSNSPVSLTPARRVMSPNDAPQQEAGDRPDVSFSRTRSGRVPMIPEGLSESLEDDMIGRWMWRARNQFINNFGFGTTPSMNELPKGARRWVWNIPAQEWQPDYGDFNMFNITPWGSKKTFRR